MKPPRPTIIKQPGLHLFRSFIEGNTRPTARQSPSIRRKDIAALPYTGGTTGLPKAAMLTHRNMVAL